MVFFCEANEANRIIRYENFVRSDFMKRAIILSIIVMTSLTEAGYLEEVSDELGYRKQKLWFLITSINFHNRC